MLGYIKVKDLSSAMFDDKETIQDSKGEGWHSEEIHGRDDVSMIAQKCGPELALLLGRGQATEIARNSAFGDLKSKL